MVIDVFFDDDGAGMIGVEGVFDTEGNPFFDAGANRFGVEDAGAVVGEFADFAVSEGGDRAGVGGDAGVGAHDTIDIGPDPDFIGDEGLAEDGGAVIGATAAEGGGDIVDSSTNETSDDGGDTLVKERGEGRVAFFVGGDEVWCGGLEVIIGGDEVGGIDGLGGDIFLLEVGGEDTGTHLFAHATDSIKGAGGEFAEDGDGGTKGEIALDKVFDFGEERLLNGWGEEIVDGVVVDLPNFISAVGEGMAVAAEGGVGTIEEKVSYFYWFRAHSGDDDNEMGVVLFKFFD